MKSHFPKSLELKTPLAGHKPGIKLRKRHHNGEIKVIWYVTETNSQHTGRPEWFSVDFLQMRKAVCLEKSN